MTRLSAHTPLDLRADRRGVAAVEFALIAPALCLLVAGLIDGSRLIVQTMQVKAAAQAGADYARKNGWDAAGISNAVTSATSITVTVSPAPVQTTACVSGMTIAPTAGGACAAGGAPGNFITVAAQAPFSPIMPWPGLSQPAAVSAQAVVRLN
jgi:Flp pilus assembly protein TadG